METIREKLDRRSQPSRVRLLDGKIVRVVSSSVADGRITRLGIDPGEPGAPLRWVHRGETIEDETEEDIADMLS